MSTACIELRLREGEALDLNETLIQLRGHGPHPAHDVLRVSSIPVTLI